MAWDEQVGPPRTPRGPALRLWLRALPAWALGLVLVTVATAWPWLLLVGWLQRGGPYFWWFVLGVAAVVALAWLRFLDERALRAVPGIRGPSVDRERRMLTALHAAGAPPATVWVGSVGTDRTLCLATPTRCHVVVPCEPTLDDASLAADAAARLRTSRPWLRPLTLVAGAAWLGPFTLAAQVLARRLGLGSGDVPGVGGDEPRTGRLEPSLAVDPVTTAAAFLSAGLTGFGSAAAAAIVLGEPDRLPLSRPNPWLSVVGAGLIAALTWMVLWVWPKEWTVIRVEGVRSRGGAPEWRGTNDRREAVRNRAVIAGRRGLPQVIGTFASWFGATMWCTYVPLKLMQAFGWLHPATHEWRMSYVALVLPGVALGVYAYRSAWDLQRGNPMVVLAGGALYVVATGLAPLIVRGLVAAGAVDDSSGRALVVAHVLVVTALVVALVGAGRHLVRRRGLSSAATVPPTGGS